MRTRSILERRSRLTIKPLTVKPPARAATARLRVLRLDAPAAQNPLRFDIQTQTQTEWCWAAVTASVSAFYRPSTIWSQCYVATRALGQVCNGADCCAQGDGACNRDWYLEDALRCTLNLGAPPVGPVGFDVVRREIDGGRPIGVRFQWSGGDAGHFFVIYGYVDDGSDTVLTRDPRFRDGSMPISELAGRYLGCYGSWSNSYFTQRDS